MELVHSATIVECRAMAAASRKLVDESRLLLAALAASKHVGPRRWRSIAPAVAEEVRYWSAVLGCSRAELLAVISTTGVMLEDVRAELASRRSLNSPASAGR